jgi:2-polyprenyl-6-methoxyphenol hydroxylase-like FAD-dependent oxidoreductase
MQNLTTTCCIVGGGPAGVMLGYLLAKQGVDVTVLEKHKDFLRDFRGDTVHPSTLQVMKELNLLDKLLERPHQKINKVAVKIADQTITIGDLTSLHKTPSYIAMMPQWDFLDFLVTQTKDIPNFKILMQAKVTDVIIKDNKVTGAVAQTPDGFLQINCDLLVGADGRHSLVREKVNLVKVNSGVAIDVLWFRLSRSVQDPADIYANLSPGKMIVMINRGDYWQCAYVIPKGEFVKLQEKGLANFCNNLIKDNLLLKNKISELQSWDQVKLLEVQVNHLEQWYKPGVLCIGDAAHAMSPVGGVGINLAIQDAVSASKILAQPLLNKNLQLQHLAVIQKRRMLPTKLTQKMQILMHKNLIYKVIDTSKPFKIPLALKIMQRFPILSKLTGYIIGIGFRPESITQSYHQR